MRPDAACGVLRGALLRLAPGVSLCIFIKPLAYDLCFFLYWTLHSKKGLVKHKQKENKKPREAEGVLFPVVCALGFSPERWCSSSSPRWDMVSPPAVPPGVRPPLLWGPQAAQRGHPGRKPAPRDVLLAPHGTGAPVTQGVQALHSQPLAWNSTQSTLMG